MATDRLTFIAELRDRLTGPAKKAAQALEDLGTAGEKASHRAERADQRTARSANARARRVINVNDAPRTGVTDDKLLKAFPEYKSAVTDRLSEMTPPVRADDSTVLQYMGNTAGFRRGGYTGDGPVNAIAGAVHGSEYVFDAASTARIGVDNLRAMHHGGL